MKKGLLSINFLLCFSVGTSYAQIPDSTQRVMDSLRRSASLSDSIRYSMTFKVAYDLFDVDNAVAVKYADKAFSIATKMADSSKIVKSGRIFGQLLRRVGELNEAINVMEPVISIAERRHLEKDLRFLCHALALAYTFRGQYDQALKYNFKSLELRLKTGTPTEIALAQSNIGTTFYLIGIYDRAAEYMKASLLTDSTNDFTHDIKVSLALCYGRMNYLQESRSLIQAIVTQYRSKISNQTMFRIEYGLGYIDLKERNYSSAKNHFTSSYLIAMQDSNKLFLSDCLAKLGEIHLYTGQLASAEKLLVQSDILANKIGYRNGREVANLYLAKLYALKNDHTRASTAKSNIIAIKDSSINQGVIENIYRYQFDFYQMQNKKTIATQAELLDAKERALRYHLISNIVSWTCAVLLISIVFLLSRSYRLKKQIAEQLEQRVHERTTELRRSVESLQISQVERNLMLDGIAKRLRANLATFKGLIHVAKSYQTIPDEFIMHVDAASKTLSGIVELTAHCKK